MSESIKPTPESEFWELYQPHFETIPESECVAGDVYLGESRSIGAVGICLGPGIDGDLLFEGLSNMNGKDILFVEKHHDCDVNRGTFKPQIDIGRVDIPLTNNEEIMAWLLDLTIANILARCENLQKMPDYIRATQAWKDTFAEQIEQLELYKTIKVEGFRTATMVHYSDVIGRGLRPL